jgi:outer membrane autotransporter protein
MVSGVKNDSAFLQDSVSGYLLTGYRVGDVTPYAGLSWSRSSAASMNSTGVRALDTAVAKTIGRTGNNQHTYTLGLRWDFHSGMDVKVQWDAIRGAPDSMLHYRWEQPGWTGQTHVLSAVLDFAF